MQAEIELLCTSKPQHLGCSTSMITPPLTCDPGRADKLNLPRVLSSHEEATVRCAKARPGSNSSTGFQAPVRPKTSGPHASNSILPTVPVFIDRCGAVRHAKLIPSDYSTYPHPVRYTNSEIPIGGVLCESTFCGSWRSCWCVWRRFPAGHRIK